jgi:AraC family transcriptional activator of pobA
MSTAAIPAFFLYGEPQRHAEPRFVHLEDLAVRSRPADWRIRAHAHRDLHHLMFLTQGGGRMQAEAEQWSFRAPVVLVCTAGGVHGFEWEPESEGQVLTLAEAYVAELAARAPDCRAVFAAPRALEVEPAAFAAHRFADDLEALGRELVWSAPGREMAVEGRVLCLVSGVMRLAAAPAALAAPGPRAALVARFREEVERRFRARASIEDYAEALGVTPARLRAACAHVAHAPPMALVADRVMLEARRMLLYTNMTVAETAYELGFDDPAYFSRFFAERDGRPPSAFRAAAG